MINLATKKRKSQSFQGQFNTSLPSSSFLGFTETPSRNPVVLLSVEDMKTLQLEVEVVVDVRDGPAGCEGSQVIES